MSTKNRTKHLMIMFPVEMVEQIDEYKTENKIRTRSKAIRKLIETGLQDSEEE